MESIPFLLLAFSSFLSFPPVHSRGEALKRKGRVSLTGEGDVPVSANGNSPTLAPPAPPSLSSLKAGAVRTHVSSNSHLSFFVTGKPCFGGRFSRDGYENWASLFFAIKRLGSSLFVFWGPRFSLVTLGGGALRQLKTVLAVASLRPACSHGHVRFLPE